MHTLVRAYMQLPTSSFRSSHCVLLWYATPSEFVRTYLLGLSPYARTYVRKQGHESMADSGSAGQCALSIAAAERLGIGRTRRDGGGKGICMLLSFCDTEREEHRPWRLCGPNLIFAPFRLAQSGRPRSEASNQVEQPLI